MYESKKGVNNLPIVYFTTLFKELRLYRVKKMVKSERLIGEDLEGSGCVLFYGTIPAFTWRVRKTMKNLSQDSRSPGQDLIPEHEVGVLDL
jgi:hypothetical protein